MTRIKLEPNVPQIGTFDLQNSENVKSNPAGKVSSEDPNVSLPVSPEARASKLSEGDLQATARATQLNSLLNTQTTDQPQPPSVEGFYDLTVSHFKDSNQRTGEDQGAGNLQPKVNSLYLENTMVSNLTDTKKGD